MKYFWVLIALIVFGALGAAYFARAEFNPSSATAIVIESQTPQLAEGPQELVPDLVPLPPQDVKIQVREEDGAVMLLFSTTYYNQGEGPVELRADPSTKGVHADIERDVFQRIYLTDGSYREKVVGNFLWHEEHQHYHFADFVTYDLEAVKAPNHPDLSGMRTKTTFCLRDVSRVDMDLTYRVQEADYRVCYKEVQGVSVGWGDTYFYDYPDQGLNISNLSSGTYRLTFYVNPERKLDEMSLENNTSSAILNINMEERTVRVAEQTPKIPPRIEHIHLEQPFGLGI